jgi:Chaperone of endosialidase
MRQLQFRRYANTVVANTIGADGELIIDTTNKVITLHDGIVAGGYATPTNFQLNQIQVLAQAAFDAANGDLALITSELVSNNQFISAVNQYQNTVITLTSTQANAAFAQANLAYAAANTAGSSTTINAAFNVANSAAAYANASFAYANTINTYTVSAYAQANTDLTALTANVTVLSGVQAGQNSTINLAFSKANSSYNIANAAFAYANTLVSMNVDNTSITLTSGGQAQLNKYNVLWLYQQANTGGYAPFKLYGYNSDWIEMAVSSTANNNALWSVQNGNLNLAPFAIYSSNLTIAVANTSGTTSQNNFVFTANGLVFPDKTIQSTSFLGYATDNTARTTANSALTSANGTIIGSYANGAYSVANSALTSSNGAIIGSYANSAFSVANNALTSSNGAIIGSYANSAFALANTNANNIVIVGSYANSAYAVANAALTSANGTIIGSYANSAFSLANTDANNIVIVGSYANSAYTKANSSLQNTGGTLTGQLNVNSQIFSTYTGANGGATLMLSGTGTQGGATYFDFLKANNTTNSNSAMSFRLDNTGSVQLVNNSYSTTVWAVTQTGVMFVGTSAASSTNNDATTNYINFNSQNSVVYDDGNFHIHSRGSGQAMWINTNGGDLRLLTQTPVNGGSQGTSVIMGGTQSNTASGFLNVLSSKNMTYSGYGYLSASGAGTISGSSGSVPVGIYTPYRIYSGEVDSTSDERLKDIKGTIPLDTALQFVNNINGIHYTWKNGYGDDGLKSGFGAQSVHKAGFAHMVSAIPNENIQGKVDDDGWVHPDKEQLNISYIEAIPYHHEVIKNLLYRIEQLEKTIDELKSK